jgi:hypothetical protein
MSDSKAIRPGRSHGLGLELSDPRARGSASAAVMDATPVSAPPSALALFERRTVASGSGNRHLR